MYLLNMKLKGEKNWKVDFPSDSNSIWLVSALGIRNCSDTQKDFYSLLSTSAPFSWLNPI